MAVNKVIKYLLFTFNFLFFCGWNHCSWCLRTHQEQQSRLPGHWWTPPDRKAADICRCRDPDFWFPGLLWCDPWAPLQKLHGVGWTWDILDTVHEVHHDLVGQSLRHSHGYCIWIWHLDDSGHDLLISLALSDCLYEGHHLKCVSQGLRFTAAMSYHRVSLNCILSELCFIVHFETFLLFGVCLFCFEDTKCVLHSFDSKKKRLSQILMYFILEFYTIFHFWFTTI